MEGITKAVGSVFTLVETTLTNITSNETLMLFFVSGLISIAIGVLHKIKNV